MIFVNLREPSCPLWLSALTCSWALSLHQTLRATPAVAQTAAALPQAAGTDALQAVAAERLDARLALVAEACIGAPDVPVAHTTVAAAYIAGLLAE